LKAIVVLPPKTQKPDPLVKPEQEPRSILEYTHMSDDYRITLQIEADYALTTPADRLREAVTQTLRQQHIPVGAEMTLVITDDEAVRDLNRRFLGIDAPTDVLSFPSGETIPGGEELAAYLGDVVIAHPYTAAQAAQAGHALDHVLMLLAVHGTLHLLGFDHTAPNDRAEMWEAQAAILRLLNIPASIVPSPDDFLSEE